MKIKFEITDDLKHKFGILMGNQLGKVVANPYIEDIGNLYRFGFGLDGDSWHFELDKFSDAHKMFTLHCDSRRLEVPLRYIQDIKLFCAQIARIKEMQLEYIKSR